MTRKTTTIRQNVAARVTTLGIFNSVYEGEQSINTVNNSNAFPACTVTVKDGTYDTAPLDGVGDIESQLDVLIYFKKTLSTQVIETELDVLAETVENDFENGDKTFTNSLISIVPDSFSYVVDIDSGVGVLNLTYRIKFKR